MLFVFLVDDSEILRLLGEVEDSVSVLPGPVECTNVQAEVALALQPLRSENAQLRRSVKCIRKRNILQLRTAVKECVGKCRWPVYHMGNPWKLPRSCSRWQLAIATREEDGEWKS